MKTIESFYEEDRIDCHLFFNGKYDFWHEMPQMNRKRKEKHFFIRITFKSKEEILEFYNLIQYEERWKGFPRLPKNAKVFKIRFPGNLIDKNRNIGYRFVHLDTALANSDRYEIFPLEVLHYGEK